VSHDRTFLDNVVTSTIAFEGKGQVHEYIGGYEDWLRQKRDQAKSVAQTESQTKDKRSADKPTAAQKPKKLSYNLQRELDQLPQKIDALEKQIETLTNDMADPAFYQQDQALIADTGNKLKALQDELDNCFNRWEELEA